MDFQQRYEFNPKTDLLGRGGFSKVYRATDTLLDRTVALKFFTGTISDKYQVLTEIKKVIRFEHPNLCKYYDVAVLSNKNVVGETEQIEVGIMEYIDGGDFKTYTRKNPQHIDKLLIDVLKGLGFLHRHGIAHRDLKPQNILVKIDEDGPVSKITDFGISKVIASEDANSSTLLGTIEYMAPEQFNPKKYGINGRITTNLDLWSFGLLVYESVCHESFFGSRSGGISAEQVMANILGDAPWDKADTMPEKYREIVKRCLVKHAGERVQNALELIPLLENKVVPVHPLRTNAEFNPDQSKIEAAPAIKPEMPGIEDPQDNSPTQEITSENTMLIDFADGVSAEQAQGTRDVPDVAGDETKVIPTPDTTAEITRIIKTISEETGEITKDTKSGEIASAETGPAANEQLLISEREQVKPKPYKKIAALTFIPILLVVFFIAYSFLSRQNRLPKAKPVAPIASPVARPPVEDWKPELIPITGGTFVMGDMNPDAPGSASFAHPVTLGDFSPGKYEVSVAQFKKFIDETGYITTAQQKGFSDVFVEGKWRIKNGIDWRYDVRGNLVTSNATGIPVVHVSWRDATAYCGWLSAKTRQTYRLLTEAEWEFAARGGNKSGRYTFSGSDSIDQVAWYQKNSDSSVHSIGEKKPNELGIYDMSGNALEWCSDWYDKDYYKKSPAENPQGPESPARDSTKVLRGGAWAYAETISRIAHRTKLKADVHGGSTGFRVCRVNK